jgi:hypothetical protein
MQYTYLRRKLKQYGYTRKAAQLSILSNKSIIKKNFKDKSLNHTNLKNSDIHNSNFDNAALTGSYFYKCDFADCKMNMTDLEYCEFYNCSLMSKHTVVCSFNESNFLDTTFKDITFSCCSFSGSLFENCIFDNVKIEFTTLENVIFRNCIFRNMDMKVLNFNFVEFDNPTMKNVILPLEQIPHAIGILKYCMSKPDEVTLGSDTITNLSITDYIDKVLPLLEEEFQYTKEYFPLANIYLARSEYQKAFDTLHSGLEDTIQKRDFRTLKFYCKLIVQSQWFSSRDLHGFYSSICRLSPCGNNNNSLTRSYIRNIAEIKNILFDSTRKSSMHITFLAEYVSKGVNRIGELLLQLLGLSRMENFQFPNTSSIKISKNSPLFISLDVNGCAENIGYLLPELLSLSDEHCSNYQFKLNSNIFEEKHYGQHKTLIDKYRTSCAEFGITLTIVEYYLENCEDILYDKENIYYYNSDMVKYSNLLTSDGAGEWNIITASKKGNFS